MKFLFGKLLMSLGIGSLLFSFTQLYPDVVFAQSNGCGPEGYGLLVPDGPFTSACDTHDECYGDGTISQATCDEQFKTDMYNICETKFSGGEIEKCKVSASYYYRAVSNFGETFINLEGQKIAGEIVSVSARRIDDWIGDDEFEACVTFRNNGTINTEYDLQLLSDKGEVIDTEPDSFEINLKVGETAEECVGTNGIFPSISDLGSKYKLVLRVDAPEDKLLSNLVNDFTQVDLHEGNTP